MLAALILAAANPQAAALKPVCKTPPTLIRESRRGRPRTLGSEPPAKAYYSVFRTEDGCQKPMLVNEERRRPSRR